MSATSTVRVSIIIPTYNEERNILDTLARIVCQDRNIIVDGKKVVVSLEIIMVDSGSKDRTIHLAKLFGRKYNMLSLYSVPKFHHSIVRNFGAKKSEGEILVFLNADAKPANSLWLRKLIGPIVMGIADASFSRQIPPRDLISIDSAFVMTGFPEKSTLLNRKTFLDFYNESGIFFSTVSCAVRRDTFFELGGFNKYLPLDEDQDFALRLIKRGYTIAYVADSIVIHAHKLTATQVVRRYYGYAWGWKRIMRIHKDLNLIPSLTTSKRLIGNVIKLLRCRQGPRINPIEKIRLFFHGILVIISVATGYMT